MTTTIDSELRLELAKAHDFRFRELERQRKANWSEQAELAQTIQDNHEYRELGFEHFDAWLSDAAPSARSTMFAYMSVRKELSDLKVEDIREIGSGSAKVLAGLPKKLRRQRGVLDKAKQGTKVFVNHLQETHPELHVETIAPESFAFTKTQRITVDGCIELAMAMLPDLHSKEAAIESVCADFLTGNQDMYEKLKNEGKL